jgi:site-specific recombinase XerD
MSTEVAESTLLGFEIGAHALRATAATNALDHNADIAKVQEWLAHANIATTRIYDLLGHDGIGA